MAIGVDISKIIDSAGDEHRLNAAFAAGIPFAQVDSTSTSTAYTATVPGITEYKDGVCVMLKNGVVTSESGFTININGLGAKPSYTNLASATRDTTIFNIAYTMLFVYDEDRVAGGCWICYRGYDANTNTIGYQLRTNSTTLPMDSIVYRYRLLFHSADGTKFVPANNSTSTNATASRTTIQTPIDPFGPIYYYGTTASVAAGSRPSAAYLWTQYLVTLGYSFNRTGAALTLTTYKPVFIKAAPQSNGSAIIDADTPYVQDLPTTKDGKIYIYLGIANSATQIEMFEIHPVYWYDGTGIRMWTGAASSGGVSSVAVSQTVTSGTEIAEIDVDGTATKLYTPTVPAPLIGSTANTTPTQVLAALQAGKNVYITHTDATFGNISFTSFAYSANLNIVQAQAVVRVFTLTAVTLMGDVSTDTWTLGSDNIEYDPIVQYIHVNGGEALPNINNGVDITIPTKTSDLTNDSGFLTSAVTSFNGSTGAVTYTAPVTSVNGNTGAITGLQTTGNLVTSVSSSSTDSQYPSAKLFYDTVGNIETLLQAL